MAGGLVTIAKKYRTCDLYPSTYCQTTGAIAVGILTGGVIGAFAGVGGQYTQSAVPLLAMAAGFLTAVNVEFLARFLRKWSADATGTALPSDIPSDLSTVIKNSDAVASLTNISLWSVSEFVKTDPIRLYLNMSQPVGVINGWIDEALLSYYFQDRVAALAAVHVVRFSALLELVVDSFDGGIVWRKDPRVTGDAQIDQELTTAVRTIVTSRIHELTIAIVAPNLRRSLHHPPAERA